MRNEKIDNSKWMLTLLIVLYHIQFPGCEKFQNGFMFFKNLGDCVVPAFAIISGFLFWRNVGHLDDIWNKMTRRVWSLLIPYLLWNCINIPVMNFLKGKRGVNLLDFNFLYDIVLGDSSPHFWYIFMLMFWTVLSPVLYFLYCKKSGNVLLFVLSFGYLLYKGETVLYSRFIYIVYTWAGLIGYYYPDLFKRIEIDDKKKKIVFAMLFFAAYLGIYFVYCGKPIGMEIKVWLCGVRAVFLLFVLINLPLMKIGSMTFFQYSFWIFAVHFWLDSFLGRLFARIFSNVHLYQLVTWLIVSIFALGTGFILNKRFPTIFRLLIGGRE